jgi:hypothetical protein
MMAIETVFGSADLNHVGIMRGPDFVKTFEKGFCSFGGGYHGESGDYGHGLLCGVC